MTVQELSKLYWLNREMELQKRQIEALEAEIAREDEELRQLRLSLDGLRPANTDGMPHGTGVHSPVENTVEHILALEEALDRDRKALVNLTMRRAVRIKQITLERDRLTRYIDAIADPVTQQIFTLRFVNGLSWEQVAVGMGEGYIAGSVKKACYRYLHRH